MIDAFDLARVLAVGGFLPLLMLLVILISDRGWRNLFRFRDVIMSGDSQRMARLGEQLFFIGIIIGIAPDTLIMLDGDLHASWITIDRALDAVAAPLMVGGVMMMRGSTAFNPKFGLAIWGAAIVICSLGGFAMVLVS